MQEPRARWRQLLPIVVALGLVAFVLARIDYATFWRELTRVELHWFALLAVGTAIGMLLADSLATVIIYRWTVGRVSYRDFMVLRGASYLPAMINHHVGQAFLTYYLARLYDVKVLRVAGGTLVGYASWAGCLLGAGSIALAVQGDWRWLMAVVAGGCCYLALLRWRPALLAERRLLAPLFEVGVKGHLVALAARIPHFLVLFFGSWLPFELFGVHLPWLDAAAYIPMLMLVVTLPITPQGFGTRDAFAAVMFVGYASGATEAEKLAQISAATLSWGVGLTLALAVLGLVLLRFALPRIAR